MQELTTVLFRPVGPRELDLLRASGWRRWPPRLSGQPIFYPVTNEEYAVEIASRWNVEESGSGYVTRFRVRSDFIARYDVQCVGAAHHTEWWIPAEDLEELNDNIVGAIEVVWSSDSACEKDSSANRRDEPSPGEEALRVRFDGPSNGWLAAAMASGRNSWEAVVSYTPNDFLVELVTALLSCATHEDETLVAHATTEPDVYVFTFLRQGEDITFTVREERHGSSAFSRSELFRRSWCLFGAHCAAFRRHSSKISGDGRFPNARWQR